MFKREMDDVLLLEQVHGLLVTVIKEWPKSSDAQQRNFLHNFLFELDVLGALLAGGLWT